MEETISTESNSAHVLRLALVFLGAVLGLLVLSFVFGSSSARADDGGDSPDSLGSAVGGLVSDVTEPVQATVTTVNHAVAATPIVAAVQPVVAPVVAVTHAAPVSTITTPVAALADATIATVLGDTALGDALGTTPVGSILDPVVQVIEGPVAGTVELVTGAGVQAALDVQLATSQAVPTAASTLISGFADGALAVQDGLTGSTTASGFSAGGIGLFAALSASGFLVLLAFRRQALIARAMPGSPVYETDSSPD